MELRAVPGYRRIASLPEPIVELSEYKGALLAVTESGAAYQMNRLNDAGELALKAVELA